MKATVLRYLSAAGSIFDIAPSTDYSKIIQSNGDSVAMKSDIWRIGRDFDRAMVVANASKAQASK